MTNPIQYAIAVSAATEATAPSDRIVAAPVRDGVPQAFDAARPFYFEAIAEFDTQDAAQAFAARFPKGVKMEAKPLFRYDVNAAATRQGIVTVRIKLGADKANGGVNEAGLKRIKALAAACRKLGIALEPAASRWANASTRTIEQYGWTA